MTYIVVPIAADNIGSAGEQIKHAKSAGAEMLELRVDYLAEPGVGTLKALLGCARSAGLPLIVTCRDPGQGGKGDLPLELRTEILAEAILAGVDYVDCEYDNYQKPQVRRRLADALSQNPQVQRGLTNALSQNPHNALSQNPKSQLILSAHNFDGPWPEGKLAKLYEAILTIRPDAIPKLVYKAKHINDCFAAFDLLNDKEGDAIAICMGAAGLVSRVLAPKLSGFLTFASVDEQSGTAPGQPTISDLKGLYRFDDIGPDTEIFGVIGNPVGHSLSPAIFNASFSAAGLNAVYLPILIEGGSREFAEFMDNVVSRPWLGFGGFSVTIPHKPHALDYLSIHGGGGGAEPLAREIGAVNTIKIGFGGILSGYNTDYAGAMDALTAALGIDKHQLHSVSVAVVGAGGVGRAIIAALADVGAKVTIYNRTVSKAEGLAREFSCKYAGLDELAGLDAQVVINCTSIGMHPNVDDSPVPAESLTAEMTVFDTVYNPLKTKLLQDAENAAAKTITGAEMFIKQAIAQYKLFIGAEPEEKIIRETIINHLKKE